MTSEMDDVQDLRKLTQIATSLNRATDVYSALNDTLAQLIELMSLQTGWIFLADEDAQERWAGHGFRLAAHYQLPPAIEANQAEAWDKGCSCQALCRKGELEAAYNEVRCSRLGEASGDRRGLVVHASAPLHAGDRLIGILNVAAPAWTEFTPRALLLLTNVGSMMGTALERARLFDLMRAQRIHEQAALLNISAQLLSRRDPADVMQYLVEEVRTLLAVDACALLLPGPEGSYLYFRAATGWQSQPVENQYRVPADERSGSGRVMQTQRPLLMQSDSDSWVSAPWMAEWLETEGFQSAAIVPLVVEGRAIGALVIDTRTPRSFETAEIRFLQLMANQAAIAIDRARLHEEEMARQRLEEELTVSRHIQLSMLPPDLPQSDGWSFAAVYEPASQVGGDFYDFFEIPEKEETELGLVIADVSDKGVPAALFMALARTTIRNNALRGRAPADALYWANQFIQEDSNTDMFLTAFYGVLELKNGRFRYANAGHNPPLWWQADAEKCALLEAPGIVLGVLDEVTLEERAVTLTPGDVLVLYTDGVTEAMDETYAEFGIARLKTAVTSYVSDHPDASAADVTTAILQAVRAFTHGTPQFDDLTLLVVRYTPAT